MERHISQKSLIYNQAQRYLLKAHKKKKNIMLIDDNHSINVPNTKNTYQIFEYSLSFIC